MDVLIRNSTWTYSRDTDLKFDFVAVNYYDGQGFMVKKELGVSSAKELDGATICIQTGTTTELNLADFFKANNMTYTPVTIADDSEGQGPLVRHGDNNWGDIVRWTYFALVSAEELGITAANVEEMATTSTNPEVKRLLGSEGEMGAMMGLDKDWAKRAIAASGNYGEIFAANIGESTSIGLARGLNALWTQGGLQYAPPFR